MLKKLKRLSRRLRGKTAPVAEPQPTLPPDLDPRDVAILKRVEHATMTSPERISALCGAVRYIDQAKIPGDIVECGVWRGGSMMAIAHTLNESRDATAHPSTRELWLYDTFEGMSEPTQQDRDFLGGAADELLNDQDRNDPRSVWCVSHLEEVQSNLAETGYPSEQIHFVKGRVEETIPARLPEKIALLRLDTDWYESTRHELIHLFPRLVEGGVLIIDDYGHWEGCRRAVDEYFAEQGIPILLQRIDYTGRMALKMPTSLAISRAA